MSTKNNNETFRLSKPVYRACLLRRAMSISV